ncbi:MAG: hypothetical protein ACK559_06550, partial [bacterium]
LPRLQRVALGEVGEAERGGASAEFDEQPGRDAAHRVSIEDIKPVTRSPTAGNPSIAIGVKAG